MGKLNEFNKSYKKRNFLIIGAFFLVGLILVGISYAVYQKEDEVRFINAKVGSFETSNSDIELAITLDGEDIDTPPSKGYYNVTVECDYADGKWDKDKWLAEIGNIKSNKVKCNVSFETLNVLAAKVELGDYISMTPTSTSYTLPNNLSGCTGATSTCIQNTLNPSELNLWRVIRKNEDGTVDIVSEYVSSKTIYINGRNGYINCIKALNTIAAQYTDGVHIERTRHMGYSNQTEIITDTKSLISTYPPWSRGTTPDCFSKIDESLGAGDVEYLIDVNLVNNVYGSLIARNPSGAASSYWIASRMYSMTSSVNWGFHVRIIRDSGVVHGDYPYHYNRGFYDEHKNYTVRPIITIKSNVKTKNGDGKTKDTAYELN